MSRESLPRKVLLSLLILLLAFSPGCVAISQTTKERINAPVDCSTAEADIAYLEDEKAGGPFRALSIVTGLFPVSAVILIVRGLTGNPPGAWTDKFRVGFGRYNRKIEAKVEQTRSECGITTSLLWGLF